MMSRCITRSRKEAEAVVKEIAALGRKAVALRADLLIETQVEKLVPMAVQGLGGPLTVLINNASIFEYDTVATVTRKSWDRHMESNLRAPFVYDTGRSSGVRALGWMIACAESGQRRCRTRSTGGACRRLTSLSHTLCAGSGADAHHRSGFGPARAGEWHRAGSDAARQPPKRRKFRDATRGYHLNAVQTPPISPQRWVFFSTSAVTGQMISSMAPASGLEKPPMCWILTRLNLGFRSCPLFVFASRRRYKKSCLFRDLPDGKKSFQQYQRLIISPKK